MGFFGRKKTEAKDGFQIKQKPDKTTHKIQNIQEEYDTAVTNLMEVKKELNQKKIELNIINKEHKEILIRVKNSKQFKYSRPNDEFGKTIDNVLKIKEELKELEKKQQNINEQITKEQSNLQLIKNQQGVFKKESDKPNSVSYNVTKELPKKDNLQNTNIVTTNEKEFNQKNSSGVIEAASIVVSTIKTKLNTTQKELETVQSLLKKEIEEHEKDSQELSKLKADRK